jgi:hypothetical protein
MGFATKLKVAMPIWGLVHDRVNTSESHGTHERVNRRVWGVDP